MRYLLLWLLSLPALGSVAVAADAVGRGCALFSRGSGAADPGPAGQGRGRGDLFLRVSRLQRLLPGHGSAQGGTPEAGPPELSASLVAPGRGLADLSARVLCGAVPGAHRAYP